MTLEILQNFTEDSQTELKRKCVHLKEKLQGEKKLPKENNVCLKQVVVVGEEKVSEKSTITKWRQLKILTSLFCASFRLSEIYVDQNFFSVFSIFF